MLSIAVGKNHNVLLMIMAVTSAAVTASLEKKNIIR